VSRHVFIPRPETEFLVEQVLTACRRKSLPDGWILDLCCGSGAIAVVLALELQRDVVAVDLSGDALAVAQQNCRRHRVDDRVALVKADLLTAFAPDGNFPCWCRIRPMSAAARSARGWTPRWPVMNRCWPSTAARRDLTSSPGSRIWLPSIMRPGGEVFIEIGAEQGPALSRLLVPATGPDGLLKTVEILKDYAGRDRVLHLTMSENGR